MVGEYATRFHAHKGLEGEEKAQKTLTMTKKAMVILRTALSGP